MGCSVGVHTGTRLGWTPLMSCAAPEAERTAALLAAPILTVGRTELNGRDLVAAGVLSGRWPRFEADLVAGLAASDAEPVNSADVDAAVREFRYSRRLTSGQDFRGWLELRQLGLADVRAALERELARRGRPVVAPAVDRGRALAALPGEAICSGVLRDCGWWLADRLLAPNHATAAVDDRRVLDVAARERELLAVSALEEPDDVRRDRLARWLAADSAFTAHAAQVASPDAVARCIDARRLDWLAFELEGLQCPTPWVAAEALAQLRDDGSAPPEVAHAAGLELRRRTLLLGDAAPALQAALAAAAAGEVVGPVALDGVHEVWVVTARTQPDASDPVVHERAVATVLAADVDRRRAGRVRWHDRD
jgi:hypothetical protein